MHVQIMAVNNLQPERWLVLVWVRPEVSSRSSPLRKKVFERNRDPNL